VLSGCLFRAAREEAPLVGSIDIEGNEALSDDAIRRKLVLAESGYQVVVDFGERNSFAAELLRGDARRIERFYRANGYYEARVVDTRTRLEDGRVDVTFVVAEGPPTRVRSVTLVGLEKLPVETREELEASLSLRPGRVVTEEDYDALKAEVQSRLRMLGFAEALVEGEVRVDPAARAADVVVTATPGQEYRIERVFVFGAQGVSRARVADATELAAGQLLTPRALADAQRRVYALGVFSLVQVDLGVFNRKAGTVPVVVTVTEAPFQTVEGALGVVADPARQVARVRTRYEHRNLARGLQRLTVDASLGFAFLPTIAAHLFDNAPADRRGFVWALAPELVLPRVGRSPVDVAFGADVTRELTQAFGYDRVGARLAFPVRFDWLRQLSIAPSLNFERYFGLTATGTPLTGTPTATQNACGPGTAAAAVENCSLFYGELRATYDGRDDLLVPRHGWFASVAGQYAGTGLSQFSYWRVTPELRGYWSAGPLTLAARGRLGFVERVGGLPLPGVGLFFAGGANSVRTAGSQQLGPRDFVVLPDPDDPARFVAGAPFPRGGTRLWEGSVEARWQVGVANLGLVAFFDVGDVFAAGTATQPAASARQWGPGVGIRWYSEYFGALRFDVSYRAGARYAISGLGRDVTSETSQQPVGLDLSRVTGADPDPANYLIDWRCPDGADFRCYQEATFGTVQLFLTLGEAF
jgi:translocation and assembly module TamA